MSHEQWKEVRYSIYEMRRLPRKNLKGANLISGVLIIPELLSTKQCLIGIHLGFVGLYRTFQEMCGGYGTSKEYLVFFSLILPKNSHCIQAIHHAKTNKHQLRVRSKFMTLHSELVDDKRSSKTYEDEEDEEDNDDELQRFDCAPLNLRVVSRIS